MENGEIVLIGATTIQPNTRIRQAILSRCQVFKLEKLTRKEIKSFMSSYNFPKFKRKHLYQLGAIVYDDDDEEQGDGVDECFDLIWIELKVIVELLLI